MGNNVVNVTNERWKALLDRMDLKDQSDTFRKLYDAHLEKHRHYHTITHLDACLKHLDLVLDLADSPDQIELALWFHDAIYQPYSSNNEERSAEWATEFLKESNSFVTVQERVQELIMVTEHNSSSISNDQTLILDIDLSILGQSSGNYDLYENAIRKEYKRIPFFLYTTKRAQLLQGFLDRDRIFNSDFFYGQLELKARENLTRAIEKLGAANKNIA